MFSFQLIILMLCHYPLTDQRLVPHVCDTHMVYIDALFKHVNACFLGENQVAL